MIAYKLVHKNSVGELESWMITGPFRQVYKIDEKVTTKVGGFLCFKRKKDAKSFSSAGFFLNSELWRVEVRENVRLPKKRLLYLSNLKKVDEFWKGKLPLSDMFVFPKGTIAYKHVTLIKRV